MKTRLSVMTRDRIRPEPRRDELARLEAYGGVWNDDPLRATINERKMRERRCRARVKRRERRRCLPSQSYAESVLV